MKIITLEGKPEKGQELPSSSVKDGLKWSWNDALVKEFVSRVKTLALDNERRKSLPYTTTKHDVFSFPDLTLSMISENLNNQKKPRRAMSSCLRSAGASIHKVLRVRDPMTTATLLLII